MKYESHISSIRTNDQVMDNLLGNCRHFILQKSHKEKRSWMIDVVNLYLLLTIFLWEFKNPILYECSKNKNTK